VHQLDAKKLSLANANGPRLIEGEKAFADQKNELLQVF
jgi:hypothetical protein